MKTMKALVKKHSKPGLWLDEVEIPEFGIDDILIKVSKTAICGTDIHIYNWDKWSSETIKTPVTIGHEFCGTVNKIGSNVKGFSKGELVSAEGHIVCGHCRNCRAGRRHLCINTQGIGIERNGAFAEYISVPASNVWRCNPKISKEVIACFDPFGNAVHTALSFDLIGEDVLITGAGPIGIMAVAIAKHAGARHVVISDINDYRLELAKKMGATRAVNVKNENITDMIKELEMTEGFDVGLEMSGSPHALNDMIKTMNNGGKIALLGIQPPETSIDWNKMVFHSLTLKGIYGRKMFETWYKMSVMIQSGLDIKPVITHRYKYEDFIEGFEQMKSGQSGKVILNWEE
jgi:threonine 3-dehydrogenase